MRLHNLEEASSTRHSFAMQADMPYRVHGDWWLYTSDMTEGTFEVKKTKNNIHEYWIMVELNDYY